MNTKDTATDIKKTKTLDEIISKIDQRILIVDNFTDDGYGLSILMDIRDDLTDLRESSVAAGVGQHKGQVARATCVYCETYLFDSPTPNFWMDIRRNKGICSNCIDHLGDILKSIRKKVG